MHIECMSTCSRHCDGDMYRRHWRCLASACSPVCACARVDGGLCSATARFEADVDAIEKGEEGVEDSGHSPGACRARMQSRGLRISFMWIKSKPGAISSRNSFW